MKKHVAKVSAAVTMMRCAFDPDSVDRGLKALRRQWHVARHDVGLFDRLVELRDAMLPLLLTRANIQSCFFDTLDTRAADCSCVDVVLLLSLTNVVPEKAVDACVSLLLRCDFIKQELIAAFRHSSSKSLIRLLRALLKVQSPAHVQRLNSWLGPVLADVYVNEPECRPVLLAVAINGFQGSFLGCEMLELVLEAKLGSQDENLFSASVIDQLLSVFSSRTVSFCCEHVQRVCLVIADMCVHSDILCNCATASAVRLSSSVLDSWKMVGYCLAKHLFTKGFLPESILQKMLNTARVLSPASLPTDGPALLVQIFLMDLLFAASPLPEEVMENLTRIVTRKSKKGMKLHCSQEIRATTLGLFAGTAVSQQDLDWRAVWAFRVTEVMLLNDQDVGILVRGPGEWSQTSARNDVIVFNQCIVGKIFFYFVKCI